MSIHKVNLAGKFSLFNEQWTPKVVGELNDSYVKLAKIQGEFVWHHHENEDELFLVVSGRFLMKYREDGEEREFWVEQGEFVVMPKGIEHCPVAPEECHIILLEPKSTLHTGNVDTERSVKEWNWI